MKINLVGTGSIGSKKMSACTLINDEILVDMPNGIVKKLKQSNCNILDIKVILITHLHGDHFFDIPFFMLEKYFNKSQQETRIYCPIGTQNKVKQLFEIAFPNDYEKINKSVNIKFIEFKDMNQEEVVKNIYVDSKIVEHGELKPAYGFVIQEGNKKVGFSGDSKLCEMIEEIIEQSNMSVLDMSLAENGNNAHMGLNDIEELCKKYKDKIIVATHMHDFTRETAKNRNIKNLIIPEDGQSINI